jgi:predicted transcriptional regulator
MERAEQPSSPRPVLLSFYPEVAAGIASGDIPCEFRKRRSGHETGTRVLMYASGKVRAFSGAYTAGTVFAYDSLGDLARGVYEAEEARHGERISNPRWLMAVFEAVPSGWAFEITDRVAFDPPLPLSPLPDGTKVKPPQGFQYLDLDNQLTSASGRVRRSRAGREVALRRSPDADSHFYCAPRTPVFPGTVWTPDLDV